MGSTPKWHRLRPTVRPRTVTALGSYGFPLRGPVRDPDISTWAGVQVGFSTGVEDWSAPCPEAQTVEEAFP